MLLPQALSGEFVPPCVPALAAKAPAGPDWVREIKYDGYRLIVRRDGKVVRPPLLDHIVRMDGAAGAALSLDTRARQRSN
jgi:hypothetical protein